ncbi:MAG: hypothetical protein WCG25_07835 [bacterium]
MLNAYFDGSDLIISFYGVDFEIVVEEYIYPGSKQIKQLLRDIDYSDDSLRTKLKIKSLIWQLREILREKLNSDSSRDPEYQELEKQYREINNANEFFFLGIQAKENGIASLHGSVDSPISQMN